MSLLISGGRGGGQKADTTAGEEPPIKPRPHCRMNRQRAGEKGNSARRYHGIVAQ